LSGACFTLKKFFAANIVLFAENTYQTDAIDDAKQGYFI